MLLQLSLFSVLYFVGFVTTMLTAIAIIILESKNVPGCGLYLTKVGEKGTSKLFSPAKTSTCDYVKYMPLAIMLYSLSMFVYHFYPLIMIMGKREPKYTVWSMPFWIINVILDVLLLIGACIISTGFAKSCSSVVDAFNSKLLNLSCKMTMNTLKWENANVDDTIYSTLTLAEASCWLSFLFITAIIGIYTYFLFLKGRNISLPTINKF